MENIDNLTLSEITQDGFDINNDDVIERHINKGATFVVIAMNGRSGAGKSTWATSHYPDVPVVSRDLIRVNLGFTPYNYKHFLPRLGEDLVKKEQELEVTQYSESHTSFILDETNCNLERRTKLFDIIKEHNGTIVGINVITPVNMCIMRRHKQISAEEVRNFNINPFTNEEVDEVFNVKGY